MTVPSTAPSDLVGADGGPVALSRLLADDPAKLLGERCLARFGPRLPFVLRSLALDGPQPVHVHPPAQVAEAGFAAQDPAAPTFTDPYGKAVLLYARSSFDVLAGLRPARSAGFLVDLLDVPRLELVRARLGAADDVTGAVAVLVSWSARDRRSLVAEIDEGAAAVLRSRRAAAYPDLFAAMRWVQRLVEHYPADPLVLAPLLLSWHRLGVGGSIFVPAGVPHAYLSGRAVALAVPSDNVARAGLTDGAVDRDAVLAFLDPVAEPALGVETVTRATGERIVSPPVDEFMLTTIDLAVDDDAPAVPLARLGDGPQVLLCQDGVVELEIGSRRVGLARGRRLLLAAGSGPLLARGRGVLFRALPALGAGPSGAA